ncbi:uncharacterized protein LOC129310159 [Prosopis cineraria]|uniref:uncharacterized protein LOC129310159 n=1 Tax=Prosopis cineraria TaxID=364024 RepID=UPI00240EA6D5|nr:uncharacterized protein LOC129310159 [Prosopis cineraria]XP_054808002.1 uncharacterized protein LOC129310159 [Prosopis cineraria]XP_054808003.1 uncharacterized protein LOC129310159 [Prosopis cineraria]XP_054808004.1 uncharacterized protein LOC129310159 [Prosopis cineraria]XP_054808005.1 uncharacterized protein LOC129310159 [Prosopis cineraria]
MGSQASLQTAKIYRHLLKAVKRHIGKEDSKRHLLEFITLEFRKNSNLSDCVAVQKKLKLARDYTFLLNSVHHHKDLLFSYNIAVDRTDEVKRVIGKSAASVGLRLPAAYQPCSCRRVCSSIFFFLSFLFFFPLLSPLSCIVMILFEQ